MRLGFDRDTTALYKCCFHWLIDWLIDEWLNEWLNEWIGRSLLVLVLSMLSRWDASVWHRHILNTAMCAGMQWMDVCTVVCPYDMYQCSNGDCIMAWPCDGTEDCPDGSDENACGMLMLYVVPSCRHVVLDRDANVSLGSVSLWSQWRSQEFATGVCKVVLPLP